jgi:cell division septation protein DedD
MEMILKIHLSRSSNSCKIILDKIELQRGQIRAFGKERGRMGSRHYKRLQAFMGSTFIAIGLGLMAQSGFAQLPPDAAKAPAGNVRGKASSKPRGGLRIGGAPTAQIRNQVEKKNSVDRPNLKSERDTQYFRVAVSRPDGSFLSLNYYPALPGENPPVILLVHEKDRSSRDFADKIEEFKDPNGLAAELQGDGFAVVTLDVAGLSDPRKRNANLTKDEPAKKNAQPAENQATGNSVEQAVRDLRLTYQFLVDRHNRLEFNLGKLTILNIGEGANASLEWLREATQPPPAMPHRGNVRHDPRQKHIGGQIASGGMNSATDRPSDVSAIILISPVESWQNVKTVPTLKSVVNGSPVNVLAIGGSTDKASADTLKALKPIVERRESRLSKVETMETGLHGARFLRFEPGLVPKINRFLEQTVEYQKTEWEPRYNLTPVAYKLLEAVSKTAAQAESRTAAGVEKSAEKSKDTPKPATPPEPAKPAEPKPEAKPKAEPAKPAAAPVEPPKTESPKN